MVIEPAEQVLALLDVDGVHLTGSALSRGAQMMKVSNQEGEVDDYLRQVLRSDVAARPEVKRSESGAHLIRIPGRTWIVRADLRSVLGVRPT